MDDVCKEEPTERLVEELCISGRKRLRVHHRVYLASLNKCHPTVNVSLYQHGSFTLSFVASVSSVLQVSFASNFAPMCIIIAWNGSHVQWVFIYHRYCNYSRLSSSRHGVSLFHVLSGPR